MNRFCWLLSIFLFVFSLIQAQAQAPQKELTALRITDAPVIDGIPDEVIWQQAEPATNFIQFETNNGKPARQRSDVRVLYDNENVYIGAILYDTAPDSILTQLGRRDAGENNSDQFGVYFDTYQDGQNAFGFEVSAAEVQTDMRIFGQNTDFAWDAVWESRVSRRPDGWSVELRIPYSALRFSGKDVQTWGLNFMRITRRYREKSFWNRVDNSIEGFVNQFGILRGIKDIEAPLRLSFMPWAAAYANHYPTTAEGQKDWSKTLTGGMDVKYGITDAFTLDLTLIPDFGQAQSDQQVLNLSPYEVKFNENRQFFTEGTELFNKGNLFYSRRIGRQPLRYNTVEAMAGNLQGRVIQNPAETRLVNAAKVSGRTSSGLGIGVFNAVTWNMYAVIEDSVQQRQEILTDPATNYNVFVLDQTYRNNSFITFTNTYVMRTKGYYDANVSGLQVRYANKKNTHALRLGGNLSQLYGLKDTEGNVVKRPELGHQYNASFSKISGNFQYTAAHAVESDTYNPNDLGYLSANNEIVNSANVRYNFFKPFWKLNNLYNTLGIDHNVLYAPRRFSQVSLFANSWGTFKNFLSAGYYFGLKPKETYDYFEARKVGQRFVRPNSFTAESWASSDYRKKLALDISAGAFRSREYDQQDWWLGFSPRFRFSDHLLLINRNNFNTQRNSIGYAGQQGDTIVFATRQIKTVTNTLTGSYIFNARTALNLNLRHYWSRVAFADFHTLTQQGYLAENNTFTRDDINFNTFNIDLVYTWRFAPGSEMSIVWKNAIGTYENIITQNYFTNFSHVIQAPQRNNFSVKVLYYLDFIRLKRTFAA